MTPDGRNRNGLWVTAVVLTAALAFVATANAAAPEFVLRIFNDRVTPGSATGELVAPAAVVADPDNGHVFVAEAENARISEYTAWGLFVKSWGWGVKDGSAELQVCGPPQPEEEPLPTLCRVGIEGEGEGQLRRATGIAMDSAGNIYVFDRLNLRVQEFSSAGQFLVMFGGDVNKTKVEGGGTAAERNRCPDDPGDVCQAGTAGSAAGSFAEGLFTDGIEYSPSADAILVGDEGRIQEFNLNGTFKGEIPFTGALSALAGKKVRGLDVASDGNAYLSISVVDNLYKLSPTGEPLAPGKPGASQFTVKDPGAVAVDDKSNVYATSGSKVVEFDGAGNKLVPTPQEEEAGTSFPTLTQGAVALATNRCAGGEDPGSLYVTAYGPFSSQSYVDLYGAGPITCELPAKQPPQIGAQFATAVRVDNAVVRALINPRFWPDTTYRVEYGTGKCSEDGCDKSTETRLLTDKSIRKAVESGAVVIGGLQPGTTYHYRFVAESGGGGPVFGLDPDGEGEGVEADFEHGLEGTLTTFKLPIPPPPCANDGFRSGGAGSLPDCRAYELVSPLDKAGGDAAFLPPGNPLEVNQSASAGERFTYSTLTPFAAPESAPYITQQLAQRGPSGWTNEAISPPRSKRVLELSRSLSSEFKAFSPDLCSGWLVHNSFSTLTADAIPLYPNAYRRENCTESANYEALTTLQPPNRPASEYDLNVLGFTDDKRDAVFLAFDRLVEEAPTLSKPGEPLLYMHGENGETAFICYLPNGKANLTSCGAGLPGGQNNGGFSSVQNAVSGDGRRVFWMAFKGNLSSGPASTGKIYLRENPMATPSASGACDEEGAACTVGVSTSVSNDPAEYWGSSPDGSRAIFRMAEGSAAGDLYEFDVEAEPPTHLIAKGVIGPMGLSEDAKRIYFASTKALAAGGIEGARNLYLYEAGAEPGEGTFKYIMGLAGSDSIGFEFRPSTINAEPVKRSSRMSADGLQVAFTSGASPTPTGYDNTDVASGKPDEEVYLYDAEADELRCVSCNPTAARPAGAEVGGIWAAARLAPQRVPLHTPRSLSEDGGRLFFDSHEALVPSDTNGTWDVYQWEAPGKGSCTEARPTYTPAGGGCVDLISSGKSQAESRFLDADPDGTNAFIATQSSLIATDFGSNDVYDARIGGGFPLPSAPAACEGQACQNPPGPPAELTPASAAGGGGSGNVATRCRKGTRRVVRHGKARCVKKKKARHKRRAARARASR